MSVIDHVDKILLWDTGSSDKTTEIIKKIKEVKGNKINFRQLGSVDINGFTKIRQKMLDETTSDWLLIVDGDEVWWEKSIKQVVSSINEEGDKLETIVNPYYNIIGDIYHYQDESAGGYRIDDRHGHINIRAINRKIPGLHLEKPHGQQGFYDEDGILIQERQVSRRKFIDAYYLHFTNMRRSSSSLGDKAVPKRNQKFKYELGISFARNFHFPEVFYQPYPSIVSSPWVKMSTGYILRAGVETVFKKVRRKILPPKTVGY